MIEIFGKEYKISLLVFLAIFLSSLVVIFLNVFYFIKLDATVFNMNMGLGFILFAYSGYNLFLKDKQVSYCELDRCDEIKDRNTARGRVVMLWIRTQDKHRLINVPGVTVKGKKVESVVGSGLLDGFNNHDLGKYESNDRALEILNEILTEIKESTVISVTFVMPEE